MEVSPYYEKKVDCLHCKKSFQTLKIRTKQIKIVDTDTDFMPIYAEGTAKAMYYNVFVCEHCGFSFTEDFSKYFAPGVQQEIDKKITTHWVHHDFKGERTAIQAIQSYQLALLCATIKKEKCVVLAGLALRLGWLFRSFGNEGQEKRFLKIALNYYLESYSNGDYASMSMSDSRITYIIAELARRLDDYDVATRFFSRVIEGQRTGGEPKLVEMAKDQWQKIREARKEMV